MACPKRQKIEAAAEQYSDLNVFAIIVAILEGGTIHSDSHDAAQQIIEICKDAMQHRLTDYDTAVENAGGEPYPARKRPSPQEPCP